MSNTKEDIKLVVVDDNALCYIQNQTPDTFSVLHSNYKSSYHWTHGPYLFSKRQTVRQATRADFKTFNVDLPKSWEELLAE